jgi:hypothetical protein
MGMGVSRANTGTIGGMGGGCQAEDQVKRDAESESQ